MGFENYYFATRELKGYTNSFVLFTYLPDPSSDSAKKYIHRSSFLIFFKASSSFPNLRALSYLLPQSQKPEDHQSWVRRTDDGHQWIYVGEESAWPPSELDRVFGCIRKGKLGTTNFSSSLIYLKCLCLPDANFAPERIRRWQYSYLLAP